VADDVLRARVDLMFTDGSPWEGIVRDAQAQLIVATLIGDDEPQPMEACGKRPMACTGRPGYPTVSASPFWSGRGAASRDGIKWMLWEEDVRTGQRRLIAGLGDGDWGAGRILLPR